MGKVAPCTGAGGTADGGAGRKLHSPVPALPPYLRAQPSADDAALRERYAQGYCALANYLYYEGDRRPQPVRALVRRELPNLRRALGLLLEADQLDVASVMADRIVRFLNFFGLGRE